MSRDKVLMGVNRHGELVFAEFEVRNGYQFSASFNTVAPFEYDYETAIERIQDSLESCGTEYIGELCIRHDVKPSDLAELILQYDGIESAYDISLYPDSYSINDMDIYFESHGCGQHDVRDDNEFDDTLDGGHNVKFFMEPEDMDFLLECWDRYHLKDIPAAVEKQLLVRMDKYTDLNESDWIEAWLGEIYN